MVAVDRALIWVMLREETMEVMGRAPSMRFIYKSDRSPPAAPQAPSRGQSARHAHATQRPLTATRTAVRPSMHRGGRKCTIEGHGSREPWRGMRHAVRTKRSRFLRPRYRYLPTLKFGLMCCRILQPTRACSET